MTGDKGAEVINSIAAKQLAVTELRVGTYTATAATDSTGYILVRDKTGTQYKVMVQA